MLLLSDTREPRPHDSEIALRPWLDIVGAIALLLAADSLASAIAAWLFLAGAVALFAVLRPGRLATLDDLSVSSGAAGAA